MSRTLPSPAARGVLSLMTLLCLLRCGAAQPTIEVRVEGVAETQVADLDVSADLIQGGASTAQGPEAVPARLGRFTVQLPSGWRGELVLHVAGNDRAGCQVALAQEARVAIAADVGYVATVRLAAVAQKGCRVSVDKSLGGRVQSRPGGIACGPECDQAFPLGTPVTLTVDAAADPTSYFLGWSGACSGPGDCVVTVGAGVTRVGAHFAPRSQCSAAGFCWENPLPQGNSLAKVFGVAENDVWAVGDRGIILHYQGQAWAPVFSTTENLRAIWGDSPANLWIAGSKGTLLRREGDAMRQVGDVDRARDFTALWGSGSSLWVGDKAGRISHYVAGRWVDDVDIGGGGAIFDLWGTGADELWAVVVRSATQSEVLHLRQGSWTRECGDQPPQTSCGFFQRIWGSGPKDVWVTSQFQPWHWDGKVFAPVAPTFGAKGAFAVWGSGAEDVWFGGPDGQAYHSGGFVNQRVAPTVEHTTGAKAVLLSAWGQERDSFWSVGDGGSIVRWNGTSWKEWFSGDQRYMNAVSGTGPNDIWVVGERAAVYHYTTFWERVNFPLLGTMVTVRAVAPNQIWMAGEYGLIYRWDGQVLRSVNSLLPPGHIILSLWQSDADNLWLAGGKDALTGSIGHLHRQGDGTWWADPPVLYQALMTGLWGDQAGSLWAVGSGGPSDNPHGLVVRHNPGSPGWDIVRDDIPASLAAIWGTSADDLWAVGGYYYDPRLAKPSQGSIWHFDGSAWRETRPASQGLVAVSGTESGDVWVVGQRGYVASLRGGQDPRGAWTALDSGTSNDLSGVWLSGAQAWLVGDVGTILHRGALGGEPALGVQLPPRATEGEARDGQRSRALLDLNDIAALVLGQRLRGRIAPQRLLLR